MAKPTNLLKDRMVKRLLKSIPAVEGFAHGSGRVVAPHVAESSLNHKPKGIEATYNRHSHLGGVSPEAFESASK